MKYKRKFTVALFFIFFILLTMSICVSFSSNVDEEVVVLKEIIPTYDAFSDVTLKQYQGKYEVLFNDKNQFVDYKVVLENIQDYDVKISDIELSLPSEQFLKFEVKNCGDGIVKANGIKEIIVSFETMSIKGWGRNFADELTANISFEKISKQEEVIPPVEDKDEEKQPEVPANNIEEIITKSQIIEVSSITSNIIEFKDDIKVEEGEKVAVWIYSEPKFLGYFDIVVTNGLKQIVGLEEALKKAEVNSGEHNIVLATEDGEVLGYTEVYVSENNTLSQNKPQDTTNKDESSSGNEPSENKPSTDNKDEAIKEENKVENPYTSDKGLMVILIVATGVTGLAIIIVTQSKVSKYMIFLIYIGVFFTQVKAVDLSELCLKFYVVFESQNTMKPAYDLADDGETLIFSEYWEYSKKIKNIYVQNEIKKIDEFEYEYDVSDKGDGRVKAYLVKNKNNSSYYDLYLQADGIIYLNKDASYYFYNMRVLNKIDNIEGLDTSKAVNMSCMFHGAGQSEESFTLDVSSFNTSNVTSMRYMFYKTGYKNPKFTLDVSNFDTSNVTNFSTMFSYTGYNSTEFDLDLSNFDITNATSVSKMFEYTGYNSNVLNITINITGNEITSYAGVFSNVALKENTQVVVNYIVEAEKVVKEMLSTKDSNSNVILGNLIN